MTPQRFARLAATTLSLGALALALTGAKAPGTAKVEKLLVKGDAVSAVDAAEANVRAAPTVSANRAQLGRAYLQAGRFASAEAAFGDALAIDPMDGASALKLALVKIALGKTDAARVILETNRERLGGADYGLAIALSGDAAGGVHILEAVTRAPGADATARQNLALAYALQGKWLNARVMAVQDLSPAETDMRIVAWMNFVRPSAAYQQVATLLGVTPVADSGQPVALALVKPSAPAPVAVAAEAPPLVFAAAREVTQPIVAMPFRPAISAAVRAAAPGRYVVQLGAFGSEAMAATAWHKRSARWGLGGYTPSSASIRLNKVSFVRLSVGGFGQRAPAVALCGKVRSAGGQCFVRAVAGDRVAAWFRPGAAQRLASR